MREGVSVERRGEPASSRLPRSRSGALETMYDGQLLQTPTHLLSAATLAWACFRTKPIRTEDRQHC